MEKRGFLILVLFLITLESALSAEELVYTGTIEKYEATQIEGKEFEFKIIEFGASVDIDNTGIIIPKGDCKIKDNFKICVTNVTWAYRNSSTWENIYKGLVNVYLSKGSLSITKTFDKKKLIVGEEIDVTLDITNSGDVPAQDVDLVDDYIGDFVVAEVEGCKLNYNTVTFQGPIGPDKTRICKYKIKAVRPTNFTSVAKLTYFDGLDVINISNSNELLVSNYSLVVGITMDKYDILIGDDIKLAVSLENTNENDDLAVTSFVLDVPKGFSITKENKDFSRTNNLISWSGKIGKGGGTNQTGVKNLTLDLKASRTGKHTFNARYSYKIQDFLRDFEDDFDFDIKCDCPYIDINIGAVVPGLKADFIVSIINQGSIEYRNLKIDYKSDIPDLRDFSSAFGKIQKDSTIAIVNQRILSPNEGEEYNFDISIAYESPFNEFFNLKKSITIPPKIPEPAEEAEIKDNMIKVELINESIKEETIEVEINLDDTNATEEDLNKEEAEEEELEPIILTGEKAEFPLTAVMIVIAIIALMVAFVVIKVILNKKNEPKEEIKVPDDGIEPPPEI